MGEPPPVGYTGFCVNNDGSGIRDYLFCLEGRLLDSGENWPNKLLSLEESREWYSKSGIYMGAKEEFAKIIKKAFPDDPRVDTAIAAFLLGND
jgi:hypothetical protein